MSSSTYPISVLDYGAGNVLSLLNALSILGYTNVTIITTPSEVTSATCIIFPGVGSFGLAMENLVKMGVLQALVTHIKSDKPYFGICLGMQVLFTSSSESPSIPGLGIIGGEVTKFQGKDGSKVPNIGWNTLTPTSSCTSSTPIPKEGTGGYYYFVHSYRALPPDGVDKEWIQTTAEYGGDVYVASVGKGNVAGCQFHPEKSGGDGLEVMRRWICSVSGGLVNSNVGEAGVGGGGGIAKRLVVALDVRSNDVGELVVTKGDQYDVREKGEGGKGGVRNLGKPSDMARKYYEDGADEIAFLNITSFRSKVIDDLPLVELMKETSKHVFVPMTVGGGIRDFTDEHGKLWKGWQVADRYFRAGADKVSIGSDSVTAVERLRDEGWDKDKVDSSIGDISVRYGVQAVVVSIDPKRVYVKGEERVEAERRGHVVKDTKDGRACWWQCTVKGGREARDICAVTVARGVAELGAGEIMLNCIDNDGQCDGYDLELMDAVGGAVDVPVIASSGAGREEHVSEVFLKTGVSAALAAGMFHRGEVEIESVKRDMRDKGLVTRM
ncbi:hypothetical protein TrCOL_g4720 [Triparma columacea]|uniref:Glutamine amidotransferase domain-containing protein n=1 Tax=Triparma columacea TaxID=722753 RepID=A0A9W7LH30_9STRA|nr:hypothetical protein TrCOL_g4720 [Triparma columacea]